MEDKITLWCRQEKSSNEHLNKFTVNCRLCLTYIDIAAHNRFYLPSLASPNIHSLYHPEKRPTRPTGPLSVNHNIVPQKAGLLLGLSPHCVRVIQSFSYHPGHWIFEEFRNKVSPFPHVNRCVRLNTIAPQAFRKDASVNSFILYFLDVRTPVSCFLLTPSL